MRWTGKASDLVELIYGVSEMGCINGGEASLKEIAAYFYKVFGVQGKAATISTMTSRCAKTRAAPTSSTVRRKR